MQVCFLHVFAFLEEAPILLTIYCVNYVFSKFEPMM